MFFTQALTTATAFNHNHKSHNSLIVSNWYYELDVVPVPRFLPITICQTVVCIYIVLPGHFNSWLRVSGSVSVSSFGVDSFTTESGSAYSHVVWKIADVIQFWEMQMSTHRTGKYKHELLNGRDYFKYNRERKRLRSNNGCEHESLRTMQNCSV